MITLSIILAIVITASFFVIRNLIKQTESTKDIMENTEMGKTLKATGTKSAKKNIAMENTWQKYQK